MGFFWSGRNASIERIFRRSARYWLTSYFGNLLWGPPGWRNGRGGTRQDKPKPPDIDEIREENKEMGGAGLVRGSTVASSWNKGGDGAATKINGGLRGSTATRRGRRL